MVGIVTGETQAGIHANTHTHKRELYSLAGKKENVFSSESLFSPNFTVKHT